MSRLPDGMYQPGTSLLHRMSPLIKILCLIILLAAVVSTSSIPGYIALTMLAVMLAYMAGLPLSTALSSVFRLKWFFLIILLMNTCFFSPENAWFRVWILMPSPDGLMQGVHVVVRVALLLVFSNILTVTTAPIAMTEVMEKLLSPLRILKIPTGQIAMILSVAIQFIPTLMEETDMIRKAQTARGARFDSRSLFEKAKAVLPLAVPIFLAAFKRADELSLAMEARGYRTDASVRGRKSEKLKKLDYVALVLCAAVCAVCIVF